MIKDKRFRLISRGCCFFFAWKPWLCMSNMKESCKAIDFTFAWRWDVCCLSSGPGGKKWQRQIFMFLSEAGISSSLVAKARAGNRWSVTYEFDRDPTSVTRWDPDNHWHVYDESGNGIEGYYYIAAVKTCQDKTLQKIYNFKKKIK